MIDRYLTAFENEALDAVDLADRLRGLKAKATQLTHRRDELADTLAAAPTQPEATTLHQLAEHIDNVMSAGTANERKALIEALIATIKITGPDRIVPVYRIPQPPPPAGAEEAPTRHKTRVGASSAGVRAMPNLVGRPGIEPGTRGLKGRRIQPPRASTCDFACTGAHMDNSAHCCQLRFMSRFMSRPGSTTLQALPVITALELPVSEAQPAQRDSRTMKSLRTRRASKRLETQTGSSQRTWELQGLGATRRGWG